MCLHFRVGLLCDFFPPLRESHKLHLLGFATEVRVQFSRHTFPMQLSSPTMVLLHTGSCHSIATQQHEALVGGPWSVCQSSKHVNIWHVQRWQQQISSEPNKFREAYLQNRRVTHILQCSATNLQYIKLVSTYIHN